MALSGAPRQDAIDSSQTAIVGAPEVLTPLRERPGSSGERHAHTAAAAGHRLLERAAARGDEQREGHTLEEPFLQQQPSRQPAWLSCGLSMLQQRDCVPL